MPSLGPTELVIILVLALVLFGAGKLADVGGALGKSIKEFRHAAGDESAGKAKVATTADEPAPAPSQKIS